MATSKRLWVPPLVGLLVAVLLGVPGGTDEVGAAPEPRATVRRIMIPAAAFIPTSDDLDYDNDGHTLHASGSSGRFAAPLTFPVQTVSIRKITLYAYDNTAAAKVCATLYRAYPPGATEDWAGEVCTVDSAASPQVVSTTAIFPRRANTAVYAPYLWVSISPGTYFHGVQVIYAY